MNSIQDEQNTLDELGALRRRRHLPLQFYDFILLFVVTILLLVFSPSSETAFAIEMCAVHFVLAVLSVYLCRYLVGVYKQIWRYGSPSSYIKLIIADTIAGILYYAMQILVPVQNVAFLRAFSIIAFNLLLALGIRLLYKYLYEAINKGDIRFKFISAPLRAITGLTFAETKDGAVSSNTASNRRIRIAIVGAGQVGVMLADELFKNPRAAYIPCCFVDIDHSKIGREIFGLPVLSGSADITKELAELSVQEIVFAMPRVEQERLKELYEYYKNTGCKIKIYDYPTMQAAEGGKRHLREFDIEELLFRKSVHFHDEKTSAYYRDKVVLITGGGGSIGSELCRQIAAMKPKKLVILDVYENGAYDIQQELRFRYGTSLNLQVEIVSVCDKAGTEKIFCEHRPNIVLHAAAHKHVPLMERNCCEAVKNNVFGTLNTVELAEKYGVERFIMVSTDKAVNPTNVMGATKRMCEMIVQSHSRSSSTTTFSATRFGNVLGSAASVVPLFKKQIMNGGPVTITDKRIIRYFMTIPEASQLVLQSGCMAKNGELFVLDMGKSVRILELAETMIRLCGFEPYRDIEIIETGLRPGEKLYEELLIRTEELDKTENSMIFIERDTPLAPDELNEKLNVLRLALESEDDEVVKNALRSVVPTYITPESVNTDAVVEKTLEELTV